MMSCVVWRGANDTVVFFQNENPYDPPSQAAWQESPKNLGYPALEVTKTGRGFAGYGMGSYSFFNPGVDIHNSMAFRVADQRSGAPPPSDGVPQRLRRDRFDRQRSRWTGESGDRQRNRQRPGQLPLIRP